MNGDKPSDKPENKGQFKPGNTASRSRRKRRMSADEKLAIDELRRILKSKDEPGYVKRQAAELLLGYERGKPVSAAAMGTVPPVDPRMHAYGDGVVAAFDRFANGASSPAEDSGIVAILQRMAEGAAPDIEDATIEQLEAELKRRRRIAAEMDGGMVPPSSPAPVDASAPAPSSQPTQSENATPARSHAVPDTSTPVSATSAPPPDWTPPPASPATPLGELEWRDETGILLPFPRGGRRW